MADPSKISSLVLSNGKKVSTEKIDERILELLGLQDEYELSYEEYIGHLREAMVASRMSKSRYSTAETESITNEWKRVKGKKGRFRAKKISAESFKKGSAVGVNLRKQKALAGVKPLALPPATDKMTGGNELTAIIDALGEIIKSLTQQNKDAKKASELDRKSAEQKRRGEEEAKLEKGPGLIAKAAEKILAPFKSLLSRIVDFIAAVFFGRMMIKLIRWFSDPENQKKFKSILRFLGDHWPVLLALYLRFGTGLGRAVGFLSKIVINGAIKLAAATAELAGLRTASRFLGGRGGKLLSAGLQVGAVVAGSAAIENLAGGDNKNQPAPKVEGRAGGGHIKIPRFAGGGFNFGGFGNMFSGLVSGQKGVDKIPAMLSDGEFVMSRGAVQKYGVDALEAMNAAGGGTNKPKMISGIPHAYGGGYITSTGRQDSRANYDKEHGEGSYDKELARRRARYAAQDEADIALNKKLSDWKNRPAQKPSGQKKAIGPQKITVNGLNVTPLAGVAGLAGSLKGMGPNVTITRNAGPDAMRPDMQRRLAEENRKSAAMDAEEARKIKLDKQAQHEYAKIVNNPDDPRYDAAWNGNLRVEDIRKQLQAKAPTTPKASTSPSPQAAYKAAGMGNYSAANVRRAQSAAGVGVRVGAKMVGGYGLRKQGFKEAPSSQIIKDASGKNVVGYKAMKGGKLTYVQGPKPGEGTSNIWERMGRAINPDAYRQSDAAAAQKKYQEASAGSIASLKARGASQLTIAKRQAELRRTAPPPPMKPRTRFVNPNQGGAKTKSQLMGSGGKPSIPKFSASHPSGHSKTTKVYGIK